MIIGIDASRANKIQKTGVEWYSYYLIEELKKVTSNCHCDFNCHCEEDPSTDSGQTLQSRGPSVIARSPDLLVRTTKQSHKNRYILYSDKLLQGDLAKLPSNWQSKVLKWPPKFLWTQLRFSWEMLIVYLQIVFRRIASLVRFRSAPADLLAMTEGRPDVLFIPAHVIPIIYPKRVVTTIQDLGFERFPEVYSWWQRFYLRWSTKFALKHAEKIIVPSEFTKKELIDLYSLGFSLKELENKIKVIYHGYDEKTYRIIKDLRFKNKDSKFKSQEFILYIGRLEKKKNVLGLIKAFKIFKTYNLQPTTYKLKSYNLILIGQPGFGYEEIKKELKDQKDIIELGWVEQKDLPYFLNKAFLFIIPSFYEGFGLPVIEAMACGTPVIASQAGSLPEITGGAALLFNPNKPEELAEAMKKVLEDENLRKKLQAKGFEQAKKFSWSKCAKETLSMILKR
jgi:glycosyltransferase involved in cell wall biosynthesis